MDHRQGFRRARLADLRVLHVWIGARDVWILEIWPHRDFGNRIFGHRGIFSLWTAGVDWNYRGESFHASRRRHGRGFHWIVRLCEHAGFWLWRRVRCPTLWL